MIARIGLLRALLSGNDGRDSRYQCKCQLNKSKEPTMFYVIKYYQLNKETGVYELKHMHCDTIKAACEYLQFMEKHPSYVFVSMKKVG